MLEKDSKIYQGKIAKARLFNRNTGEFDGDFTLIPEIGNPYFRNLVRLENTADENFQEGDSVKYEITSVEDLGGIEKVKGKVVKR